MFETMDINYVSPTVEVVEVEIEKGFAASDGSSTEDMIEIPGTWD